MVETATAATGTAAGADPAVLGFIKRVKEKPAIWNPAYSGYGIERKLSAAWRQVCIASWPDFDTLSAADKRDKCLEQQRKWKKLKDTFTRDYLREKRTGNRDLKLQSEYYDQLDFLIPTITLQGKSGREDGQRPVKRKRLEETEENEEDRHFLLSLVSFMREVPQSSKLAFRAELLQLIAKYTGTGTIPQTSSILNPNNIK